MSQAQSFQVTLPAATFACGELKCSYCAYLPVVLFIIYHLTIKKFCKLLSLPQDMTLDHKHLKPKGLLGISRIVLATFAI